MDTKGKGDIVHPVVIVGAGLSGLAIAHELQRRGVSARVLDSAERIAEAWRRRHPQLRLNTHRWLSYLPGLRMPAGVGAFPARDDVVAYLEAYARELVPPVECGVHVERLDPEDDHWCLTTSGGARRAWTVIIATGRERVPRIPDWPGRDGFTGEIIPAAALGDVRRYAGRRVLVVGAGTSGSDVLNHLVDAGTAELHVSVRHGPSVLPTRVAGVPIQLLSPLMGILPTRLLDGLFAVTERVLLGDLRRHGLPRHPDGAATRLARDGVGPAFDLGFVDAIKRGRLGVVPAVAGFAGDRVELDGGGVLYPDMVICATGYHPALEPLVGHLGILDDQGLPRCLDATGRCPRRGLRFAGMTPTLTGYFSLARREARTIAWALTSADRPRDRGYGMPAEPVPGAGSVTDRG